ncbi:hypothetical protein LEP1GSC047_0808 [Leptospira inadai serovar Lyme str. 10]|uniref:Uncharacterized protein n=2 Tax=Leptospira inadai serovar Lyme TaxID=293084 RepID=V6HJI2_9LEPT|nr:hypothetical protein [Leptospira inadai]EQA37030.1 hypothetical protein LEP1GSC047_0808 [Leptospira inadai serovar Lyme str. 10]PNV76667.1 hypothetical protein BES34_003560 [Leptospira inadai serovar Lyme]
MKLFLALCLPLIFYPNCSINTIHGEQENKTVPIIVVLKDPYISIKIDSLHTLTEAPKGEKQNIERIEKEKLKFGKWIKLNLNNKLFESNIRSEPIDNPNYTVGIEIKDMGEIRGSVIAWSIFTGITTGLLVAIVTGHSELGAGVFLYEVVEESLFPIIALTLLYEYTCIVTAQYIVEDSQGNIVFNETYNAFRNKEFYKKIEKKDHHLREMVVKASLDEVNSDFTKEFVEFLNKPSR